MISTLRTFAVGLAAMASVAGFAAVAEAAPVFVGRLIVTAQTGTCSGNSIGFHHKVRFVPANVGDNGANSSIARFDDWYAVALTLVGASFDSTLRSVKAVDVWAGSSSISGVRIAFTEQSPTVITATTDSVEVTGKIKGLYGGSSCTATFQMSVVRTAD